MYKETVKMSLRWSDTLTMLIKNADEVCIW